MMSNVLKKMFDTAITVLETVIVIILLKDIAVVATVFQWSIFLLFVMFGTLGINFIIGALIWYLIARFK